MIIVDPFKQRIICFSCIIKNDLKLLQWVLELENNHFLINEDFILLCIQFDRLNILKWIKDHYKIDYVWTLKCLESMIFNKRDDIVLWFFQNFEKEISVLWREKIMNYFVNSHVLSSVSSKRKINN